MRHFDHIRLGVVAAAVLALGTPGVAFAADPATLYSDFANTGKLACKYDRASLKRVLGDASLYQYSDARTIARLRLAVQGQLAGSCERPASASQPSSDASPGGRPAEPPGPSDPSGTPGSNPAGGARGSSSGSSASEASGSPASSSASGMPNTLDADGRPVGSDPAAGSGSLLSSADVADNGGWSRLRIGLVLVIVGAVAAAGLLARRTLTR